MSTDKPAQAETEIRRGDLMRKRIMHCRKCEAYYGRHCVEFTVPDFIETILKDATQACPLGKWNSEEKIDE